MKEHEPGEDQRLVRDERAKSAAVEVGVERQRDVLAQRAVHVERHTGAGIAPRRKPVERIVGAPVRVRCAGAARRDGNRGAPPDERDAAEPVAREALLDTCARRNT